MSGAESLDQQTVLCKQLGEGVLYTVFNYIRSSIGPFPAGSQSHLRDDRLAPPDELCPRFGARVLHALAYELVDGQNLVIHTWKIGAFYPFWAHIDNRNFHS